METGCNRLNMRTSISFVLYVKVTGHATDKCPKKLGAPLEMPSATNASKEVDLRSSKAKCEMVHSRKEKRPQTPGSLVGDLGIHAQ